MGFWALAGSLFIAMAIPPLRAIIDDFDQWFWELAVRTEWAPAVLIAKGLSFLGSTWINVPLRIGVSGWLIFRRRWEALIYWIAAAAVSEPLIGLTKSLYGRPRPPDALVATTHDSFPSGHAVAGAVIAISLVIVLLPAGPARRNWEMIAAAWALLMGASRVYLRAHWMTDVAAGVALGAAIAIGVAALVHEAGNALERRRRAPPDV